MAGWNADDDDNAGGGAWAGGASSPEASGGWNAGTGAPSGFSSGHPPQNARVSAGGDTSDNVDDNNAGGGEDQGGDNTCRICHQEGHFARECPDKPAGGGSGCFNCGEEGHIKSECPNPAKFNGTCRHCNEEGHAARECPTKPAEACRNCAQEGHNAIECVNPRKMEYAGVKDMEPEEAWSLMEAASKEDDMDDFKEHLQEYIKATLIKDKTPFTMDLLEMGLRASEMRYYLQALTTEVTYDKLIVGPGGQLDCEYTWMIARSERPTRAKALKNRLAANPEENLQRLHKAGTLSDEHRPYCFVCKEKGHNKATCTMEAPEEDSFSRPVVKCALCDAEGHRQRDCTEPRRVDRDPNVCRNCNEEGHQSTECEKPRVASATTECRKCNGMGHFSKECPNQPPSVCFNCGEEGHSKSDCTNERRMKCRNCDEWGHSGRECPKPRDITRVKCNECEQLGHFSRNCPDKGKAKPEEEEEESNDYSAPPRSEEPAEPASVPAWASKNDDEDLGGW